MQAILILVEKMNEAVTKNKYGIAIMADLEGAFDSVWRLGALYKLHKAGILKSLLLIFACFMRNRQQRNLVNKHVDEWSTSEIGVHIKPTNLLSIRSKHDCRRTK